MNSTRYLVSAALGLSAIAAPILFSPERETFKWTAVLLALSLALREPFGPRERRAWGVLCLDGCFAVACIVAVIMVYRALGIQAIWSVLEERTVWVAWLACAMLGFFRGYLKHRAAGRT